MRSARTSGLTLRCWVTGRPASADWTEWVTRRQRTRDTNGAGEGRERPAARAAPVGESYGSCRRRNWDASPISAPRLMHEVKQALPDNHLVFSEGITNSKHVEMA